MTTKRFTLFKSEITDLYVINDDEHEYTFAGMQDKNNAERIIKLLNELNDENDILKQQLKTKYIVNKQYEENQKLKELLLQFYTIEEIEAELI